MSTNNEFKLCKIPRGILFRNIINIIKINILTGGVGGSVPCLFFENRKKCPDFAKKKTCSDFGKGALFVYSYGLIIFMLILILLDI